jgi:FMN phosphatase YigB (HAD superfamily)
MLNGMMTPETYMHNYHTWLLDLDDTLQVGPLSWASLYVFPDIIAQTGIKPEKAVFEAAFARAHQLYNAGHTNDAMSDDFFRQIGWSPDLRTGVLERFASEYKPALFDDTRRFLDWTTLRGDKLYMTANNKWARAICGSLGISDYFAAILTPADLNVARKPDAAMWEHLKTQHGLTGGADTVVVGNELIFDSAFAKNCGLECIIVDRFDRFEDMPEGHFRVTSLDDIIAQVGQGN